MASDSASVVSMEGTQDTRGSFQVIPTPRPSAGPQQLLPADMDNDDELRRSMIKICQKIVGLNVSELAAMHTQEVENAKTMLLDRIETLMVKSYFLDPEKVVEALEALELQIFTDNAILSEIKKSIGEIQAQFVSQPQARDESGDTRAQPVSQQCEDGLRRKLIKQKQLIEARITVCEAIDSIIEAGPIKPEWMSFFTSTYPYLAGFGGAAWAVYACASKGGSRGRLVGLSMFALTSTTSYFGHSAKKALGKHTKAKDALQELQNSADKVQRLLQYAESTGEGLNTALDRLRLLTLHRQGLQNVKDNIKSLKPSLQLDVEQLKVDQLSSFIESCDLGHLVEKFSSKHVDGFHFMAMTRESFDKLDITDEFDLSRLIEVQTKAKEKEDFRVIPRAHLEDAVKCIAKILCAYQKGITDLQQLVEAWQTELFRITGGALSSSTDC